MRPPDASVSLSVSYDDDAIGAAEALLAVLKSNPDPPPKETAPAGEPGAERGGR